ncbi:MAG TPA: PHP domain-containing protein, partial [Methanosarcina sp.]|nr:PHP domain-containing protein [Methanosarcina sp.]
MIQLKIRTEYSFGSTFAPIDRVIKRLKELGCKSAAIVDGDTWGHVEWFKKCKAADIEPMLGVEVAVSDDETPTKMWFIAKNKDGLGELYRATSRSHRQTIASRSGKIPRLYRDDVEAMSENIIKFAGDIVDGEFLKRIGAFIDLNPSSRILNNKKRAVAAEFGLETVSTSDNAYAFPEDKATLELLSSFNIKNTPQQILDTLEHQDVAERIAAECAGLELPKAPMVRAEGNLEQL